MQATLADSALYVRQLRARVSELERLQRQAAGQQARNDGHKAQTLAQDRQDARDQGAAVCGPVCMCPSGFQSRQAAHPVLCHVGMHHWPSVCPSSHISTQLSSNTPHHLDDLILVRSNSRHTRTPSTPQGLSVSRPSRPPFRLPSLRRPQSQRQNASGASGSCNFAGTRVRTDYAITSAPTTVCMRLWPLCACGCRPGGARSLPVVDTVLCPSMLRRQKSSAERVCHRGLQNY
jgi:hypothetical protein